MKYHDEKTPYPCRFCGAGFRSKIALYDHIKVHTTLTGVDLENLISEQKLNPEPPVSIKKLHHHWLPYVLFALN